MKTINIADSENPADIAESINRAERCQYDGGGGCRKRLTLAARQCPCRCGRVFCPGHRHAECHQCTFDYRRAWKEELRQQRLPKAVDWRQQTLQP